MGPTMPEGMPLTASVPMAASAPNFETFEAFSRAHGVTFVLCASVIALVVWAGRAMRSVRAGGLEGEVAGAGTSGGTGALVRDDAGRMLGVIALGVWIATQMFWFLRASAQGPEQLAQSLPLHVCDLAALIAAVALISGSRFWTIILYYWGIGLSTQAFITPVVRAGPVYTEFWLFFESHTIIVGSAIYCVAVRGYRPTLRELLLAFGFTVGYAAVIVPLNLWQVWNYGYIGRATPQSPTIIDRLGPWPLRLLPLSGLVLLTFVLAWAPFAVLERRRMLRVV